MIVMVSVGVCVVLTSLTVLDVLLLRPVPFRDPGTLVRLEFEGADQSELARPAWFRALQHGVPAFEGMVAVESSRTSNAAQFDLLDQGSPSRLFASLVTQGGFETFGVAPLVGRPFGDEDHIVGAPSVVMLSHAIWMARFGGDPRVVGRSIRLAGLEDRRYRVVGVMPPGFRMLFRAAALQRTRTIADDEMVWLPVRFTPRQWADKGQAWAEISARLRPGATVADANAQVAAVMAAFDSGTGRVRVRVTTVQDDVSRTVRAPLAAGTAAMGFVWLVSAVSVAHLMLGRNAARRHDFAVVTALGATSADVCASVAKENLALVCAGLVLGTAFTMWSLAIVRTLLPPDILQGRVLAADWLVMLAGWSLMLIACGAATVLAMRGSLAARPYDVLKATDDRGASSRTSRLASFFIVCEVACVVVLLAGALVLGRSVVNRFNTNPGFRASGVLTASATLTQGILHDDDGRRALVTALERELEKVPGVLDVGFTSSLPMRGADFRGPVVRRDETRPPLLASQRSVSPGYFRAMGIAVIRGRAFERTDESSGEKVALLSERAARLLFGEADPLDRLVTFGSSNEPRRVVGIVGDVRHDSPIELPRPMAYAPYAQWPIWRVTLVMRTDDVDRSKELQQLTAALAPGVAWETISLDDLLASHRQSERFFLCVFAAFAMATGSLCILGIYFIVSRHIRVRRREWAIRMVLGAEARGLQARVLGRAGMLFLGGVVCGVFVSAGVNTGLRALLYNVGTPQQLAISIGAASVVLIVAIMTTVGAMRHAFEREPAIALREA